MPSFILQCFFLPSLVFRILRCTNKVIDFGVFFVAVDTFLFEMQKRAVKAFNCIGKQLSVALFVFAVAEAFTVKIAKSIYRL